jgi:hypothetical protein
VSERPGVVDLRDLEHRYMWQARKVDDFVAAAGLVVEARPTSRAFAPPRVLVLIAPFDAPERLERARPWLTDADHIVLVRDMRDDVPEDALRQYLDGVWVAATERLAGEALDWRDDATAREAIARATELAAALSPRAASPSPVNPDVELAMSPWVTWSGATFEPRRSTLSAQLAFVDDRPVILRAGAAPIDLGTLREHIQLSFVDAAVCGRVLTGGVEREQQHPGMQPFGIDPVHPTAWRGHRMAVYWSYVTETEVGFLSATDHEWPNGPAKKLWGYDDNHPISIALAPDATACALTFEHDVTIINNVPVGWHRAGDVDVAAFVPDLQRAAFYAMSPDLPFPASDDLLEEDNRELPPAFVLGPSPAFRYAIDLRYEVVRITGPHENAHGERIGGPDEGYAVFDANHTLVRRGTGRLLGGWFRYATIEDNGALWREDLATGERTHLGSSLRIICDDPEAEPVLLDAIREGRRDLGGLAVREVTGDFEVLPIPGTRNVIELTADRLRVI